MDSQRGGRSEGLAISCAFEENAIRAISREAHRRQLLTVRALSDPRLLIHSAERLNQVLRSPTLHDYVSRHAARAIQNALPEDVHTSVLPEFVRIAGARFRSPLTHRFGNATWKVLQDRAVRHVDFGDAATLISMPGSSLDTFRANRSRRLVLHEVDAHPRTHNESLQRFYGHRRPKAEIYPDYFVERIEQEISLADHVLVPSRRVRDQMRANGVASANIVTIPYGVEPSIFRPGEADLRGSSSGRLQAVFTGQVNLIKGVSFLIEAVRGQPIDLAIAGQIFDTRIVHNLPSNISLLGVLTAKQLAHLYARMDVFVLPSIEDAFGLVVTEAVASGLPVITTRQVGAHEFLSSRHAVVEAGDIAGLREALSARSPLTWDERHEISTEGLNCGWATWDVYADHVIDAVTV